MPGASAILGERVGVVMVVQRLCCVGCGTVMARTDVAVAVYLELDRSQNACPLSGAVGCGWVCASCASRAPTSTTRTYHGDGFWWAHDAVNPALPCEGCGQLVCLRTHHLRTRVLCSNACRVRTNRSHRVRGNTVSLTTCEQCGVRTRSRRSSRRYCSPACRQRAYRIRTATSATASTH